VWLNIDNIVYMEYQKKTVITATK